MKLNTIVKMRAPITKPEKDLIEDIPEDTSYNCIQGTCVQVPENGGTK